TSRQCCVEPLSASRKSHIWTNFVAIVSEWPMIQSAGMEFDRVRSSCRVKQDKNLYLRLCAKGTRMLANQQKGLIVELRSVSRNSLQKGQPNHVQRPLAEFLQFCLQPSEPQFLPGDICNLG